MIQSESRLPKLTVRFFGTTEGHEPVREWLRALPEPARKRIGDEIRAMQFGWPVGMPLVRKLDADLWEVRVHLDERIARVLLHGFIKKSQKTPVADLETAMARMKTLNAAQKRAKQ